MLSILKKITPDKNEKKTVSDISKYFISKLSLKLKEGKIILGGSVAKDTWIRGDADIDVFAVFNKKYSKDDISKILEKRLKEAKFPIKKIHGSRDYFQIKQGKYNFEVVPILDIKKAKDAENITDVSPEILTVYYGSFEKLIENSKKWKEGLVIDIEKHYDGLNESKKSPLIVIDPVQNNRNTAAALSKEKFERFIEKAKEFSRNPNESFFEMKSIDEEKLKGALVLEVKSLKGKKDIIGSKLLKTLDFIADRLKDEGYEVENYDWEWDKNIKFWYFIKEDELSERYKHFGPPIKEEGHLKVFKRKYKNYKLLRDDGRVYVELKRKYKDVFSFVRDLLKHKYLKDKVKEIKLLS